MATVQNDEGEFGLQIAPMLDILFVLLLFFMVSAGSQKKEQSLSVPFPGGPPFFPEPVAINVVIDGNNEVTLNGSEIIDPVQKDKTHPSALEIKLSAVLQDNAEQAVVISPSPKSTHQTIIDVLNACSGAHVRNIAFTAE